MLTEEEINAIYDKADYFKGTSWGSITGER